MYTLKKHYRDKIAGQWDMTHDLINAVRQAKGLPLSVEINPYNRKDGKGKKESN